ncbi:HAD-IC family P-type ATPase [Marivirga salinae]|uniref:HAD-IC family P-type ATPase n=1 Tax=Marivirga salinarum TaxID=3059078 RepID=A0AA51NBK1_9BACT|nr:HAD-IC family P-type ATPase [Marivirga sp. BDSF4-3]WMN12118.1 HAD-IC family P-type ATPase [Marivirga sp. BDSF4-3]
MVRNFQKNKALNPHALSIEETLNLCGCKLDGLSDEDVKELRNLHGWNELPEISAMPWWKILLKQFKSLMFIILLVAALIAFFAGHKTDTYVIIAVVIINAMIGFIQELKAERTIYSLKKMVVHKARVVRNGVTFMIPSRDLVPGDIIVLEEGESIPADGRLIEAKNLQCMEASLTGESIPISKDCEAVPVETVIADRKNMVWKGTFVASGYAKVVVTSIGLNTAIGEISRTLSGIKREKTNFQKKTNVLARQMVIIAILSTISLFLASYFSGDYEMDEIILVSMAALVAAIPEGLPAILAIVLAIGSRRMAKRNAIIRDFTSVETLGAVTTIITDKTGTLTQNTLTVKKIGGLGNSDYHVSGEGWSPVGNFTKNNKIIDPNNDKILSRIIKIAAISNNSEIKHNIQKNQYELMGDPTEGALLCMSRKAGLSLLEEDKNQKLDDLPFNSKHKIRATLLANREIKELLIVGAPEKILQLSTQILTEKGEVKISDHDREALHNKIESWSEDAMRVIGLAYKKVNPNTEKIDEQNLGDLVFAGITGMIDPPRPDTRKAVENCKKAGIRVIMATGDHINTAIAIAKSVSIIDSADNSEILALSEKQLLQMDDLEFDEAIKNVNVFARLTPNVKLKIAERLQAMGELIAMTGDGVNDAPALKRADVGVAMGIMGTDVARDAAQVVLADDNFATIVAAVEEGRIVFTNARQTSFFLVTTNFAEITTLVTLIFLGLPMALTATQILWLNLVTDGICDISLATEKGHNDVLEEKPVNKKEKILNKIVLPLILIMTVIMTSLSLIVYFHYLPEGIEKARTTVFIIMAFTQLFNLYNMRSLKKSIFNIGFFSNKYINIAIFVSILIQIIIIEVPFFERIFAFQPVSALEFIVLVAMASLVIWSGELYKLVKGKLALGR